MEPRHGGLVKLASPSLVQFVVLEALEAIHGHRGLLTRELLLEIVSVRVELIDHVVDFVDVLLERVLLLLYFSVPLLCKQPFDVGLGLVRIVKHLEEGSAVLAGQHICLHLHQSTLLVEELFSDNVRPKVGLYHERGCQIGRAHV